MATVSKEFTFEAAHRLTSREAGVCSALHGHSYRVRVTVFGSIDPETGMVLNFKNLDCAKDFIESLDHRVILNPDDPFKEVVGHEGETAMRSVLMEEGDPTAENIAKAIFKYLRRSLALLDGLPAWCGLQSVTIWETPRCSATVTKEDLQG